MSDGRYPLILCFCWNRTGHYTCGVGRNYGRTYKEQYRVSLSLEAPNYCLKTWVFATNFRQIYKYRESLSLEAPNYCLKTWVFATKFLTNIQIQGESVARGPKLLSIKNYVIEIMTWKFIYTYRERCKTGPAHNRCWNRSPVTSDHTWMRFSKFWNTFPKTVDVDGLKSIGVWRLLSC